MPEQTSLAVLACCYEFATNRLLDAEHLTDAEARAELLAALTHGTAITTHIRGSENYLAVDALARGAGLPEVAGAMGLKPGELSDRLRRWADMQLSHEMIDQRRYAEIWRLVGAR